MQAEQKDDPSCNQPDKINLISRKIIKTYSIGIYIKRLEIRRPHERLSKNSRSKMAEFVKAIRK